MSEPEPQRALNFEEASQLIERSARSAALAADAVKASADGFAKMAETMSDLLRQNAELTERARRVEGFRAG